ncbi:hypothetical protein ACFLIM_26350 [Nonomuraea sp. M3C6]|uniref:Uncharacterized protein n=1 Tax=Nonomuraea marmarensis TaxID=3351344 RepID=A0ABW7AH77_9ACTN
MGADGFAQVREDMTRAINEDVVGVHAARLTGQHVNDEPNP